MSQRYSRYIVLNLECLNVFRRLTEAGIIEHWFQEVGDVYKLNYINWFTHPDRLKPDRQQLSLKNLSGAFYVLIIGYQISFVVLIIEIFVRKIRKPKIDVN